MTDTPRPIPAQSAEKDIFARAFPWLMAALLAILLMRAALDARTLSKNLLLGDLDDMLRLTMLRDWLAGQSWFDSMQHRMMPPEGVSIHWTRYIDAGIAAFLVPLSWVLPMEQAEIIAMTLWPALLYTLLIVTIGFAMRRISGAAGACGAMLLALIWAKFAHLEFSAGRIDHHNVQILCCTILICAYCVPHARASGHSRAGVIGGLAFAMSLAVGLEMLPALLIIWTAAGLRLAFDQPGSARWLTAFALTTALAAPLLMIGQTAPAEWATAYCDELAPPALSLVATGLFTSLVAVFAVRAGLRRPLPLIVLMAATTALGFALAAPLLGPCLAGPYGDMTPEARALIPVRIGDTKPAAIFFRTSPAGFDVVLVPMLALTLIATVFTLRFWRQMSGPERQMMPLALAITLVGIAGSLFQFRAMTVGAAALPFLAGFVTARAYQVGRKGIITKPLLLLYITLPFITLPASSMVPVRFVVAQMTARAEPGTARMNTRSERISCLQADVLRSLDRVPPATIVTSTEFGVPLLLNTRHSITAAPYHRSGINFWNGYDPFVTEADMLALLHRSTAEYILICAGAATKSTSFSRVLQADDLPPWLSPVTGIAPELRLLKVDRAALPG